jgi:DNA-binding SARP family transcriptional activator
VTAPIGLIGELDIRGADGEPIAHIESAGARSLLAYLLLHDTTPQSRQRLAFALARLR